MKAPPASTRATYHHGDLRRALLDTAIRLVAERGPEGFSLREAARAVGVSPGAAYRHFADKPALLAAIASEGQRRLATAMERAAIRTKAPDPRTRAVSAVKAIGQAYIEFAVRNPSVFRVMFGVSLRIPGFEPGFAPSGRDGYEILGDSLDELVRSGATPAERRPGGEVSAWSAVHGFATLLVDGALPMTAQQRADAFLILVRSLLLAAGCDPALVPPAPPLDKEWFPHQRASKPTESTAR